MGSFSSTSSPDIRFDGIHPLPKRFEIIQFLGEGGSAVVLKCFDTFTHQNVAVKFAKGKYKLKHEAEMMKYLMKHKLDQQNVIKFHQSFSSNSCLVFEMCDINLKDYIKQRHPLKFQEIRTVIQQLATALEGLKKVKVIHSDIKTNNIMVVNQRTKPLQIKLIDFGLALHSNQTSQNINQCLFYKAPELILGLPYSSALDIWSLGCVMGKMLLNCVLFPGSSDYENLCYITDVLGPAPDYLVDACKKSEVYFKKSDSNQWILKSPVEYWGEEHHKHKKSFNFRFLHQAKMSHLKYEKLAATVERRECIALIKAMLRWDAKKRITPKGILKHSFIVRKSDTLPQSNTEFEQEPCTSNVTIHPKITSESMKDVKGRRRTYDISRLSKDFDKKLPPRPSINQPLCEQLGKASSIENRLLLQMRDGKRPSASTTLKSTIKQEEVDPSSIVESRETCNQSTHPQSKSKQKNFFESICLCWKHG
ncbi:homeodomain-interacting protein kinase 1-like isoform X2 [Gambusia affinis]|uniref:homeodomain-interacting protein kinase 1-like isoform X2 n=1 Tax=Gambusia affinis TaxID=33528 RepID=UPI001CDBFC3A|nr:homeodomain-interacting protein kinase 1-like isoform X2 [Gambusia affinis]